ncbi:ABC transporter permease [Nocardioides panacisoli]|uniref:ABC transporter permease n=1 Tax=Nocardioides panacisoli TaxID=627624 RepID=UPI001C635F33|nr:ABC transporter permease [Nocardioides panacisoli]QYJ04040.1 ABC transporter permease [Nocardioides panacisoli]
MIDVSAAGARLPATPDSDGPDPDPTDQLHGLRALGARFAGKGIFIAPVFIVVLTGLWLLHRRSLDLDNAQIQLQSILDWEDALQPQLLDHLQIAAWSTLIVIAVAVPLGILLTRPALRRVSPAILTIANSGQALPAYGLLIIFLTFMGQGKVTAIWALALFALLPVLRNTMVGLDSVDRSVIEAGRGMGMTRAGVLARIEMPLAVPVILTGIRTAMTINIGMATLAFLIGGSGLGVSLYAAIQLNVDAALISVAWLVAIVAITFDWIGALAERYLHPRGL